MSKYDWTPFDGHYHKIEYDLRLQSGKIVERAWPNDGVFYPFHGCGPISGEEVEAVRPSIGTGLVWDLLFLDDKEYSEFKERYEHPEEATT